MGSKLTKSKIKSKNVLKYFAIAFTSCNMNDPKLICISDSFKNIEAHLKKRYGITSDDYQIITHDSDFDDHDDDEIEPLYEGDYRICHQLFFVNDGVKKFELIYNDLICGNCSNGIKRYIHVYGLHVETNIFDIKNIMDYVYVL